MPSVSSQPEGGVVFERAADRPVVADRPEREAQQPDLAHAETHGAQLEEAFETLDFLFGTGQGPSREADSHYLLLLDLRMPKVDGIAVFRTIRQDEQLRRMPVVVLSSTDNRHEIEACEQLHCSRYIVKAAGYKAFTEALQQLKPLLEHRQAPRTTGQD